MDLADLLTTPTAEPGTAHEQYPARRAASNEIYPRNMSLGPDYDDRGLPPSSLVAKTAA